MIDPQDFIAIHQLLGRYGHAVDARAIEQVAHLFVADGTFDMTALGGPSLAGVAAIEQLWIEGPHPSAHHTTNIVIEPIGAGRWQVVSKGFGHWPDGAVASCVYTDVVMRSCDDVCFVSRVVTR